VREGINKKGEKGRERQWPKVLYKAAHTWVDVLKPTTHPFFT